jgi:hypothetical protein
MIFFNDPLPSHALRGNSVSAGRLAGRPGGCASSVVDSAGLAACARAAALLSASFVRLLS